MLPFPPWEPDNPPLPDAREMFPTLPPVVEKIELVIRGGRYLAKVNGGETWIILGSKPTSGETNRALAKLIT